MLLVRDVLKAKEMENQLKGRVDKLAEINRAMVGRELKMVELKKEIQELKDKLEQKE